jgi:GT2 family glycosyltransferase
MTNLQPSVYIIILNWNGCDVTIDCLKSLNMVYYSNFKILVVDNGSKDGSVQRIGSLIKEMPSVSMLALDKNYGFTGGNNKGVEYVLLSENPDYFLLINNDTVVDPDFLLKMISLAETDDQILAVVPKIFYFDNPTMLWYAGGYINKLSCIGEHYGKNKIDSERYSHTKSVTFMNGCAILIKSETISELGLFDDDLFANCEDVDLSLRILQAGKQIMYEPNAIIWHKVSYSFKSNNNNWLGFYIATRNLVILQMKYNLKKWYFPIGFAYFLSRWFIYLEIKFFLQGKFTLCKYIFFGFKDGFTKKLRLL